MPFFLEQLLFTTSIIAKHFNAVLQPNGGSIKCLHKISLFTAGDMNRSWIIQPVTASVKFTTFYSHFSLLWFFFIASCPETANVPHYLFTFQIVEDLATHRVFRYRHQVNQLNNLWKSGLDVIWYKGIILPFPQKVGVVQIKSVKKNLFFSSGGEK